MVNMKKNMKIAGVLAASLTAAGCQTSGGLDGSPLGHSSVTVNNTADCTITKHNNINLFLIGFSNTSSDYDKKCARNQIARIAISSGIAYNPVADSDMKAFGVILAGMDDMEIADATEKVANGMSEQERKEFYGRVEIYRESIRGEGEARAFTKFNNEYNKLFQEYSVATGLNIDLFTPQFCSNGDYANVTAEFKKAYPAANVTVQSVPGAGLGLNIEGDTATVQKAQSDLCTGTYLAVQAQEGSGSTRKATLPVTSYQTTPMAIVASISGTFAPAAAYSQQIAAKNEEINNKAKALESLFSTPTTVSLNGPKL